MGPGPRLVKMDYFGFASKESPFSSKSPEVLWIHVLYFLRVILTLSSFFNLVAFHYRPIPFLPSFLLTLTFIFFPILSFVSLTRLDCRSLFSVFHTFFCSTTSLG